MAARLKPVHRTKALALLARGMQIPEVATELQQRYHPQHPVETVQSAYFPARGTFAISRFENAPRETILAGLKKIKQNATANAERARQRMIELHQNPEFATARDERMRQRHQDPEFATARDERMRQRHQDPEFRERLHAGIERFWNNYRAQKLDALERPQAWEEHRLVPTTPSAEQHTLNTLLRQQIELAATALTPRERRAISDSFNLELEGAAKKPIPPNQLETLTQQALHKLRQNPQLQQLFND